MQFRAAPIAVLAAIASLSLSGCSGDDDSSSAEAPASSSTSPQDQTGTCRAEVAVTGAIDADWSGKAESVQPVNGSPSAYYTAEWKKGAIQVFAEGGDIPTSAVVTVGKQTFTTAPGQTEGLDVDRDGGGADIDAPAAGIEGDEVQLVAMLECAED